MKRINEKDITKAPSGHEIIWDESKAMAYFESRSHEGFADPLQGYFPSGSDISADETAFGLRIEHQFAAKPFDSKTANALLGNVTFGADIRYSSYDIEAQGFEIDDTEVSGFAPYFYGEKRFSFGRGGDLYARAFFDMNQISADIPEDGGPTKFDLEPRIGLFSEMGLQREKFTCCPQLVKK